MMARICDECKKNEASMFRKFLSKEVDPSGNGYNFNHDYKDLCIICSKLRKYRGYKNDIG